jgi:hypothetical protein
MRLPNDADFVPMRQAMHGIVFAELTFDYENADDYNHYDEFLGETLWDEYDDDKEPEHYVGLSGSYQRNLCGGLTEKKYIEAICEKIAEIKKKMNDDGIKIRVSGIYLEREPDFIVGDTI